MASSKGHSLVQFMAFTLRLTFNTHLKQESQCSVFPHQGCIPEKSHNGEAHLCSLMQMQHPASQEGIHSTVQALLWSVHIQGKMFSRPISVSSQQFSEGTGRLLKHVSAVKPELHCVCIHARPQEHVVAAGI